jgi:hypothetical protein
MRDDDDNDDDRPAEDALSPGEPLEADADPSEPWAKTSSGDTDEL